MHFCLVRYVPDSRGDRQSASRSCRVKNVKVENEVVSDFLCGRHTVIC